jgi:hypothetical protein
MRDNLPSMYCWTPVWVDLEEPWVAGAVTVKVDHFPVCIGVIVVLDDDDPFIITLDWLTKPGISLARWNKAILGLEMVAREIINDADCSRSLGVL